jgi:hypothetical protein
LEGQQEITRVVKEILVKKEEREAKAERLSLNTTDSGIGIPRFTSCLNHRAR